MFLRANKRFKDGKEHRYWSVVENRRLAGGRSVQKTLVYLGEINDRAVWTRANEAIDERDHARQIHIFPEDSTKNGSADSSGRGKTTRASQSRSAPPMRTGDCPPMSSPTTATGLGRFTCARPAA